jgi:hypothetical protein
MKIYQDLKKFFFLGFYLLFWILIFTFCVARGATLSDLGEFNLQNSIWSHHPKFAYRIIGVGAGVLHNSFTRSQYNRYSGAFLDDRTKDEIMSSIPGTGLWLNAGANLNGFDIIINNFVISMFGTGSLALRIPKDVFDLALYGNALDRRYEANDLAGRTISYWGAAASYHLSIRKKLQIGTAIRYLGGIYIFETLESQAYLLTTPSFMVSEGKATYRLGRGGSGVGLDLNIAYDFLPDLRTTLALFNLNTGINWTNNPENGYLNFALDSINWSRIQRGDFFSENSTVVSTVPFRTPLPFYIMLGANYRFNPILNGSLTLSQSFNESQLTTRAPRLTGAIEFRGLHWLPVELGMSLGGKEGFGIAYSLGVIIKKFSGSFAVQDLGGFFLGAKGTAATITLGYNLYPDIISNPSVLRLRGNQ